ncbi:hypothetical protein FSP39_007473 [Pinctada imbricata]|uniref:Zinc transporter ZIP13 n=1 Tax=Pinctada imbricata TaxID=66713 RepID=A0AA88Y9L3_PINIB|nr:hypothetical protein FSP39_007473 [Pinctada imbricata]
MSGSASERAVYEVWMFSICGAMLVGLSGIFPLLVIPIEAGPALKHGAAAQRLRLLLSFAVGGLLGDVFLHLLPEAWAHLGEGHNHQGHINIGLWVLGGILSFLIIEKVFAKEGEFEHMHDECETSEDSDSKNSNSDTDAAKHSNSNSVKKSRKNSEKTNIKHRKTNGSVSNNNTKNNVVSERDKQQVLEQKNATLSKNCSSDQSFSESIKVSGYLNLLANVIDNFTHGLAVGGSFLVSNKVGFITTCAILLHEIPHEVGDFAILLRSGFNRWKAAKAQLLTASGGMVGAITALTAESAKAAGESTSWILPFTSGGFIYIALVTVVPDLLEEKHGRESLKQILCLCSGIAAMMLVTLIH